MLDLEMIALLKLSQDILYIFLNDHYIDLCAEVYRLKNCFQLYRNLHNYMQV